jgi:CubicO group peptidase (beta-lactamase class C family)
MYPRGSNNMRTTDKRDRRILGPGKYSLLCGVVAALGAVGLAYARAAVNPNPPMPTVSVPSPVPQQPPAGHPLTRDDVESWLDGLVPFALERGDVAGAMVVVVKDGAVLLEKGYGFSDMATRKPVDAERTLFRAGSTSKVFTWTAVMQQVEQGKLDLDADINGYLDFKIPARDGKPITLRNIMTHTAGFEESLKSLVETDPRRLLTLEALVKRWTPERIFPAGSTPAYSNYATALAGYMVRRVSGQPFDDYMDQHVFAPLGMAHSSFRQPLPKALQADMSNGYGLASETSKPYELIAVAPAGALASTGSDMARFMIAHLQDGAYGSNRILTPETARQMHTTVLNMIPPLDRMLLGFYESNYNGHRVIAHGGDTQWFHSDLNLFIDDQVGVFMSVNSVGKEGGAYPIRDALFREFADRYFPGPTATGDVNLKIATGHAQLMSGRYESSRRPQSSFFSLTYLLEQVKVASNDDGTLDVSNLHGLAGQSLRWREIQPFVWREVGGKTLLAAKIEDGRVARFSVNGFSPFTVFEPVPWWRSSAWLLPMLLVGTGALVFSALSWPIAALVRRRYGAALSWAGIELKAYRLSRIAVTGVLVTLTAWVVTLASLLSHLTWLSPDLDWWFWVLQLTSLVVFLGATAMTVWNVRVVWTGRRRWFARCWSLVLVLSCLTVLWVALTFKLIGFNVNY